MIKIYYRKNCRSSQLALNWMKNYKVPAQTYKVREVSKEDLVKLISLTEQGIGDILKHQGRMTREYKEKILYLDELNFNAGVEYLVKHPEVLRSPMILGENKSLIGYNVEEIRKFLPREYRRFVK